MSEPEILDLGQRHEIGAHTINHPVLTEIDSQTLHYELAESRAWLESVVGKRVTSFCYPRGSYNREVRNCVEEVGYEVARTVERYSFAQPTDPFAMPTTINVYPFPLRPTVYLRSRFDPIKEIFPYLPQLKLPLTALQNWSSLAIAMLDRAARIGGVFHLWGHSHEIERYGMWTELETVLRAMTRYPHAQHVTNTMLVRATRAMNSFS
jgi:peptidoglycan/xylan/chitin deacetylase (PgdA/CDA1 family)